MSIITHTVRYQKTVPSSFTSVEEALADYRSGLSQELQDALADHETECIRVGAVTEPATYSFDVNTQILSFVKKTEDVSLMLKHWIYDPLRANLKGIAKQNNWMFLDETPVITTTGNKGFFDAYAEKGGAIVDMQNTTPEQIIQTFDSSRPTMTE